jgi:hypothetical protein
MELFLIVAWAQVVRVGLESGRYWATTYETQEINDIVTFQGGLREL